MISVELNQLHDALQWVGGGDSGNADRVFADTGEQREDDEALPNDLESNDRYLPVPEQHAIGASCRKASPLRGRAR